MENRYVVTKRSAGLGDLLTSLGSAWWYAKHTKRQLVIDWRNSSYYLDPSRNLFPEIFEGTQEIGGVQLHGDISQLAPLNPTDFYPTGWTAQNISQMAWETPELNRDQCDMIKGLTEKSERVVVFSECLPDLIADKEEELQFFKSLKFNPACVEAANKFVEDHFGEMPIIGLHVRHGNGGYIMGHTPFWKEVDNSMSVCCEVLRKCMALYKDEPYGIYLATDSIFVEQTIQSLFPDTNVYPKHQRDEGTGELHRGNLDPTALQDSLIEMLILARSHLLIRFPPGSFFSRYASIVKPPSRLYSEEIVSFCEATYNPKVVF